MKYKYTLPQTIDEPFKFILFTIDELILFVTPIMVLGFLLNSLVTGCIVGAVLVIIIRKVKGEQGHFYLINLMYWYLPPIVQFQVTPPSHIRAYLG